MSQSATHLLVTGASGQVGRELAVCDWPGWRVTALGRDELDLADADAVRRVLRGLAPQIIVNAAAYTAVDRAESERDLAWRVNAEAPTVMAEEAACTGALLVHYSTDYVFDGTSRRPYREEDEPHPAGVYGASKLAGEQGIAASGCDHLVLRTSWVYSDRGSNFLLTMLRLAKERGVLRVVDDQRGTPTLALDLARMTARAVVRAAARRDADTLGLFHVGNSGETTWHGFAVEIMRRSGNGHVEVVPISTAELPTPAARPAYSVLDKSRFAAAFGGDIPDWRDGLDRCLARLRQAVA